MNTLNICYISFKFSTTTGSVITLDLLKLQEPWNRAGNAAAGATQHL